MNVTEFNYPSLEIISVKLRQIPSVPTIGKLEKYKFIYEEKMQLHFQNSHYCHITAAANKRSSLCYCTRIIDNIFSCNYCTIFTRMLSE